MSGCPGSCNPNQAAGAPYKKECRSLVVRPPSPALYRARKHEGPPNPMTQPAAVVDGISLGPGRDSGVVVAGAVVVHVVELVASGEQQVRARATALGGGVAVGVVAVITG